MSRDLRRELATVDEIVEFLGQLDYMPVRCVEDIRTVADRCGLPTPASGLLSRHHLKTMRIWLGEWVCHYLSGRVA
jgi:hypothetical protein